MAFSITPKRSEVMCRDSYALGECEHRDCAEWRAHFLRRCPGCGNGFEGGQSYSDHESGTWHFDCLADHADSLIAKKAGA